MTEGFSATPAVPRVRPGVPQVSDGDFGVLWRWPCLLVAQRSSVSSDVSKGEAGPLLFAPNARGLALLDELGASVQAVSIVRWTPTGHFTAESVEQFRSWGLRRADGSVEPLILLLCSSGAVYTVDDDELFEADEAVRQWAVGDMRKPASKFLEVFTVEARVVALERDSHAARVQTADGREYIVTAHTEGGCYGYLTQGSRVQCVVTQRPPLVVSARLVKVAPSELVAKHQSEGIDRG